MHGYTVYLDGFTKYIASRTFNVRHYRGFLASQCIQQTGFTRVRFTDDHGMDAFAHNASLLCFGQGFRQLCFKLSKVSGYIFIGQKIDFFFGKINRGLYIYAQGDQPRF